MKNILFINLANLIVLIRSLLIFLVVFCLNIENLNYRIIGMVILAIASLLDWFDGYIARKCGITSKVGGLLDTLGDRIMENLLLVFFAYKQLIPLIVPLIFVARSLISDFIRYLNYNKGFSTFAINQSRIGKLLVASKFSRASYLILKIIVFFAGGLALVIQSLIIEHGYRMGALLLNVRVTVYYASIAALAFNIIRFLVLIYDSRKSLRDEFNETE